MKKITTNTAAHPTVTDATGASRASRRGRATRAPTVKGRARRKGPIVAAVAACFGLLAIPASAGADDPIEIYSDQTSFQNWSWAATDLASTEQVHGGSSAIAVDYGPWHGLFLASPEPIDLPTDGTLEFWVHGGTGSNLPIRVALVDENRNPTNTVTIRPRRNRWTLIEREISDFGSVEQLTGIWWLNGSNRTRPTVFFDDIRIRPSQVAPPPVEPPPIEPPPVEPPPVEPPPVEPPPVEPPPVEPPPVGVAFAEDFSGDGSLERFDFGIYHRDDHVVETTSWLGDHASTGSDPSDPCGLPDPNPDTVNPNELDYKRVIERGDRATGFNDDWIYRCSPLGNRDLAHLMTSIGDTSGYSIGGFAPKQSFTGVTEVRWDVNITNLGNRQFPEIKLIPVDRFDFQNLPCAVEWLPCDTSTHSQLGSVGTSFFNDEMLIDAGSGIDQGQKPSYGGWPETDPARDSIRTRRTHFFRDNGDGTLTFGIEQEDGSFNELTGPGAFPSGAVRVVFADHNYTPLKAVRDGNVEGPITFTWHWDDIAIITS